MKIHVIVARESGTSDPAYWVEDAVDEFTIDEWNGAYPDSFAKRLEDPDRRVLIIEIPDKALTRPFKPTTVAGTVAE